MPYLAYFFRITLVWILFLYLLKKGYQNSEFQHIVSEHIRWIPLDIILMNVRHFAVPYWFNKQSHLISKSAHGLRVYDQFCIVDEG